MFSLTKTNRAIPLLRRQNFSLHRAVASQQGNNGIQSPSARLNSSKADTSNGMLRYVYVHPLSQIVLECLQSNYSEWLVRRQLHCNTLFFHRDGTFEIKVPSEGKIQSRIWTSFDVHEKKHWLTVQRGNLFGRYLLQDNLMSAWVGNRKGSLPDRIHGAVKEMIEEVEDFERKKFQRF